MEREKIDRINELYKKSKTEGLTPAERDEQQALRTEYRLAVTGDLANTLSHIRIQNADGTVEALHPKKRFKAD